MIPRFDNVKFFCTRFYCFWIGFAGKLICMFTSWLFEQRDRGDSVGILAKTAYRDYNAGCAGATWDAVAWRNHFRDKHNKHFVQLMAHLENAFVEYCFELNEFKATK